MCNRRDKFYFFEPLFPVDALGDSARRHSIELADELGAPVNMAACNLIAMFAGVQVGASCFVSKNFQVGMSMFLAVGAPSGASKSPCEARHRKVLEELIEKHLILSPEDKRLILAKREMLEEKRKKIKKKSSSAADEAESNEYARMIADIDEKLETLTIPISPMMGNMTIYSFVGELGIRNGCGIRSDSEGGILAELHTVPFMKLTPFLNVWSNLPVENITSKIEIIVPRPFFVNFTMWQIEPMCQFIRSQIYRDIGFVARWLFHIENNWQPRVGRGCVSSQSEAWYKSQLERTLLRNMQNMDSKSEVDSYCLSEDASNVLYQFKEYLVRMQSKDQIYDDYQDIAMKLDVQAVRIAMALCAMEYCECNSINTLEIGGDMMLRACCMALYFANASVSWIEYGPWDAARKEALPLIKQIALFQKNHPGALYLTTNEISDFFGYSKVKCRRMLYWMVSNRWMRPEKVVVNSLLGNPEQEERWFFRTSFSNL
jgi:hypothetical protein